jgi:hypothetical protein
MCYGNRWHNKSSSDNKGQIGKKRAKKRMTLTLKIDHKDIKVNVKDLAREEKKRHEEASTHSISIFLRGGDLHSHLPWPRPMQLNQSNAFGPDPVMRETRVGQQQRGGSNNEEAATMRGRQP